MRLDAASETGYDGGLARPRTGQPESEDNRGRQCRKASSDDDDQRVQLGLDKLSGGMARSIQSLADTVIARRTARRQDYCERTDAAAADAEDPFRGFGCALEGTDVDGFEVVGR